ncbi:MAG: glutamate-5-semialdehyde dehydrogenase [Faecalibacterium sp.]
MSTQEILQRAKAAKPALALASTAQKNAALAAMADALLAATPAILAANTLDCTAAQGSISPVMLDRLMLNEARVVAMAEGMRAVADLPDPVGRVLKKLTRPNGIQIEKTAVPMGVIAIIYESRPNVTSDAAALALKSGNVCVLRGGKEAFQSANAIVSALRTGLVSAGLPQDAVSLIQDTTRASATALMTANGFVDLLIPRGGAGLIRACVAQATVPCIQTGTGICHIYLDKAADPAKALRILENAKASRPSVCNAAEVCLIHADIAEPLLPQIAQRLGADRAAQSLPTVSLRVCPQAAQLFTSAGICVENPPVSPNDLTNGQNTPSAADVTGASCDAHSAPSITLASGTDFDTEFLDYILAIKVVRDVSQAMQHIADHSTGHSEAIITEDKPTADYFCTAVDSAAVYHNCSTRFTDGGEFGLGCEMGISTQKLHARGPMGLCELCTYKYIIRGTGQIR